METEAAAARASAVASGIASRSLTPKDQPPAVRILVAKHQLAAALSEAKVWIELVHSNKAEGIGVQ